MNINHSFPWKLILIWAAFLCLLAGVIAQMTNMPSLWGRQDVILEYMLPIPFGWGMLHYPGLIIFGFGLVLSSNDPASWLGIVRRLCIGTLFAVFCIILLSDVLRGFPLVMYLGVDATTALIFSTFIFKPFTGSRLIRKTENFLLIVGPSALAIISIFSAPLFMERYNFAKSDTLDISSTHDVVQFWVYLNYSAKKPKDECDHLKKYAEKRKQIYPRADGARHRKIILFESKEALKVGGQDNAWVSYEWWPDGRVICSADLSFK